MNGFHLAADVTAVIHVGIAAFLVGGFTLIWVGYFRGWKWIRHRKFRYLHGLLLAMVTLESIVGLTCPLTALEDWLRYGHPDQGEVRASFIQKIVHRILYYDMDPWVFTVVYILFLAAVLFTWKWIPPDHSSVMK